MRMNSRQDIYRFINDQDVCCLDLLVDNWAEIAGDNLLELLEEQGFSWGDDLHDFEISEEDFWDCFRDAEKPVKAE